ncbi:MBL fold metallo-hydrolase [candidate division KSB1 bacterium]|nr:MBL fold metallo-hydrolase [candidate division KSB1 bacterium]
MDHNLKLERRLITIGTGSGIAEPGKGGSAFLVQVGTTAILLDCGEGAAGWLNHYDLTRHIGYIFITHMHADHISGLYVLIQNMKMAGRNTPLFIYMPEQGIEAVKRMLVAMYLDTENRGTGFTIRYREVRSSNLLLEDNFSVRAWASDHFSKDGSGTTGARSAFGYTVESQDCRLVYTGDVASMDCFKKELVPDSTLICEAAHVSSESVLKTAEFSGVKRVIFIHVDPFFTGIVTENCQKYKNAVIAGDGMEFEW